MDLNYSHIVEVLTKNIGVNREDLFRLSGFTSKRAFLTEMNVLIKSFRIATIYERLVYAPRVFFLYEIDEKANEVTARHQIKYLPTEILKIKLGYKNQGTEPEDKLEYELEITGYELREEHKHIFEKPNNITLNFNRFKYSLWAKYLTE